MTQFEIDTWNRWNGLSVQESLGFIDQETWSDDENAVPTVDGEYASRDVIQLKMLESLNLNLAHIARCMEEITAELRQFNGKKRQPAWRRRDWNERKRRLKEQASTNS